MTAPKINQPQAVPPAPDVSRCPISGKRLTGKTVEVGAGMLAATGVSAGVEGGA